MKTILNLGRKFARGGGCPFGPQQLATDHSKAM